VDRVVLPAPARPDPDPEADGLAGVDRAAAADGDDAVMAALAEGGDPVLQVAAHRITLDLGESVVGSPAAALPATASFTMGSAASPGSVTNSGRVIPSRLQARASSAIRPTPKRISVGKRQVLASRAIGSFSVLMGRASYRTVRR
jgi:hypothetical protein